MGAGAAEPAARAILVPLRRSPAGAAPPPARYHPALVKHLPLPRLGLAAGISLALLCGCGASDSGSTGTGTGAQGSASSSTETSASGSGTCANVPARTDDFHQKVALTTTTPDGLRYGDIQPGSGPQAESGEHITMQYTGWLQDGTSFDSSRKPGGQPFPFTLGAGQVIKGWDEGIVGMRLGGVRRLVIPPALGYGASGQPPVIPANATLTFDVQLICIG